MTTKRLFIAVDIKPELELDEFYETLKDELDTAQIKWVNEDIFHLTLKFLGDTDMGKIPVIESILRNIATGFEPINCKVQGLGFFGSPRDPRVLYAGIEDSQALAAISQEINKQLQPVGIEPEYKIFKAHLTLGRIKSVGNSTQFQNLIRINKATFFQQSKIDAVILYESILRPQGPQYIALSKSRLGG
jgi:2'-5' RNA ligase